MKKALLSLLFSLVGLAIYAQSVETAAPPANAVDDQAIRKATEALTEKYRLNADQAKQMYTIQVRKAKNLSQIESLKSTDPALYRAKVRNVQNGTLASIQRILQSKEQVDLYRKTQAELRVLRNQKQKELISANASKEAIETALLAIYAE